MVHTTAVFVGAWLLHQKQSQLSHGGDFTESGLRQAVHFFDGIAKVLGRYALRAFFVSRYAISLKPLNQADGITQRLLFVVAELG